MDFVQVHFCACEKFCQLHHLHFKYKITSYNYDAALYPLQLAATPLLTAFLHIKQCPMMCSVMLWHLIDLNVTDFLFFTRGG